MVSTHVDKTTVETRPDPPLFREVLVGVDFVGLVTSLVFWGLGVPKALQRQGIVLVPGFLSTDTISMTVLYIWLMRIGYDPYMSGIGLNARCFNQVSENLETTIDKAFEETESKVWLIGHSLGGVITRSAATRWPDKVGGAISLGGPISKLDGHTLVMQLADWVRDGIHAQQPEGEKNPDCFTKKCLCPAVQGFNETTLSADTHHASIYTETDGVVHWEDCLESDETLNYRVNSLCHNSLVCSVSSFQAIATIARMWQVEDRFSA